MLLQNALICKSICRHSCWKGFWVHFSCLVLCVSCWVRLISAGASGKLVAMQLACWTSNPAQNEKSGSGLWRRDVCGQRIHLLVHACRKLVWKIWVHSWPHALAVLRNGSKCKKTFSHSSKLNEQKLDRVCGNYETYNLKNAQRDIVDLFFLFATEPRTCRK